MLSVEIAIKTDVAGDRSSDRQRWADTVIVDETLSCELVTATADDLKARTSRAHANTTHRSARQGARSSNDETTAAGWRRDRPAALLEHGRRPIVVCLTRCQGFYFRTLPHAVEALRAFHVVSWPPLERGAGPGGGGGYERIRVPGARVPVGLQDRPRMASRGPMDGFRD